MTSRDTRILQVAPSDIGGGAERVAADLHRAYRERGLSAWLAVGTKRTSAPGVIELSPRRTGRATALGRVRTRAGRAFADPRYLPDRLRGLEDLSFPATRGLLGLPPEPVDVLHLHNLHGGYFDLRELPRLSHAVPTLLTLHDTWLTAGHCAYTVGCERWRSGCGSCPDLGRPIALERDTTAANWRRKRDIFRRSRLFVAGPSRWVLGEAADSILAEGTVEAFHVPNGVDTSVFFAGDGSTEREALGIARDALVLMFSAQGADTNPFKDLATIRRALPRIARQLGDRPLVLLAVGAAEGSVTDAGRTVLVPYSPDPAVVACHLRAADVYVHMAHGENYPLAVLEAQACGTPVVASAVGGIPETLVPGETGMLVPEGDDAALAETIAALADDPDRLRAMGAAAARHAAEHHALGTMAEAYLALYERIRGSRAAS